MSPLDTTMMDADTVCQHVTDDCETHQPDLDFNDDTNEDGTSIVGVVWVEADGTLVDSDFGADPVWEVTVQLNYPNLAFCGPWAGYPAVVGLEAKRLHR